MLGSIAHEMNARKYLARQRSPYSSSPPRYSLEAYAIGDNAHFVDPEPGCNPRRIWVAGNPGTSDLLPGGLAPTSRPVVTNAADYARSRWRTRVQPDVIIDGILEPLFAPKIFLCRLDRNVAQQKLNLLQFASGLVT